jgi:hypothetical protein
LGLKRKSGTRAFRNGPVRLPHHAKSFPDAEICGVGVLTKFVDAIKLDSAPAISKFPDPVWIIICTGTRTPEALMYRCPHCGDLSVSGATQFSPPFNGRTKCPTCHTELKVKLSVWNFLFPLYFLTRAGLGFVFHIHLDLSLFGETVAGFIIAFLQIRFSSYEEVPKKQSLARSHENI